MARFVSFLVLVAILVIISIIFFQVMAGFFVPLFLAALLGVVVQPLYRWTLFQCRGYRHVAAGVTTTVVALSEIPDSITATVAGGTATTTGAGEGVAAVDEPPHCVRAIDPSSVEISAISLVRIIFVIDYFLSRVTRS